MTPDQLAAIKARNEARTPGKWVFTGNDHCPILHIYASDHKHVFHETRPLKEQEDSAKFIAHASEDIPALLAEVASLQSALEEAEKRGYDATKEQAAKMADSHRDRITGHDPDKQDADLVAHGYGNAALNIATAIRAMVKP